MENYQNQYSPTPQTDAYGNPIRQTTDELGNPAFHGGQATGANVTGFSTGHDQQGKLHRSGSSSSSSSEDDGHGGRRKKGMKEKIKEKLPGAHKDQSHATATTTAPGGIGGGAYHEGGAHEKKGIMDKIKEKLPGGHHDNPRY